MSSAMERPHMLRWRKSSYSGSQGGECIEIAEYVAWRKSSHSGSEGGDCVEIAELGACVAIRDSKDPAGPVLDFPAAAFGAFARAAGEGEL